MAGDGKNLWYSFSQGTSLYLFAHKPLLALSLALQDSVGTVWEFHTTPKGRRWLVPEED